MRTIVLLTALLAASDGLSTVALSRARPSITARAAPAVAPVRRVRCSAQGAPRYVSARLPGLCLACALAWPADMLAKRTSLSPLLWASTAGIATGSIWRALGLQQWLSTGIGFAKARLLRLGIILYGIKLTVQQIDGIGLAGLTADLFTVCSTWHWRH